MKEDSVQDLHSELSVLPWVVDNIEFALSDLDALQGERIERAKKYLLKARAELKAEAAKREEAIG